MWKFVCALTVFAILIVSCNTAPPKDTLSTCGLLNHKLLKSLSESCAKFRNHELPEKISDDTRRQILCYIYDSNLNDSCNLSQSNMFKFSEQNEVDLEKSLLDSADNVCKNVTIIPTGNTVLKQLIQTDVVCQRLCLDYHMNAEELCSASYFLRTFFSNADNKQKSAEEELPNIEKMPSNNQEQKLENLNKDKTQLDTSKGKTKDVNEQVFGKDNTLLGDLQNQLPQKAAASLPLKDSNIEIHGSETINVKAQQPIITPTQNRSPVDQQSSISAQASPQLNPAPQAQISKQTAPQSADEKTPEANVKPPGQSKPLSEQKPESLQLKNEKPESPQLKFEKPLDIVQTSTQGKTSSAQLPTDLPQDDSENKFVLPNSKSSTPVDETPKLSEGVNGEKPALLPESNVDGNAEDDDKIEGNEDEAGNVYFGFIIQI